MPKRMFLYLLIMSITGTVLGQNRDSADRVYKINTRVEIPVTVAAAGYTMYGFAQESKKSGSTPAIVNALKISDLNWLDRWGVRPYNRSVDKLSYLPFDAAVPYPIIFLALDKKMRKDYVKLLFLYTQAMTLTGALYTSAVHYVNRYRPLVYSPESPMDIRISSNARNSFFAGHVALVATSAFFMAQVYNDYHPESHLRGLMYSIAGAATLTTGYLRSRAGEHFLSDIVLGTTVGTLSGLLTPKLHKAKWIKNQRLSIIPFTGPSSGLAVLYKP
ncbi:MAG TPA: phosphatase PAP2 family protein [Puia sp.]|nr:phosphatase PAP2 family protein [Puia sp.]